MMKHIVFGVVLGTGLVTGSVANAQSAEDGEKFFKRACAACHTTDEGKNKVGPSLHGVVGRQSGAVQGFAYSPAMKGAGVTWDEESLSKYLKDPKGFIAGNKMAYAGIKNDKDLQNIIAYLKKES